MHRLLAFFALLALSSVAQAQSVWANYLITTRVRGNHYQPGFMPSPFFGGGLGGCGGGVGGFGFAGPTYSGGAWSGVATPGAYVTTAWSFGPRGGFGYPLF